MSREPAAAFGHDCHRAGVMCCAGCAGWAAPLGCSGLIAALSAAGAESCGKIQTALHALNHEVKCYSVSTSQHP